MFCALLLFLYVNAEQHRIGFGSSILEHDQQLHDRSLDVVRFVDRAGRNSLYRGSFPIDRQTERFEWNLLVGSLLAAAQQQQHEQPEVILPLHFHVTIVNLIGLGGSEQDDGDNNLAELERCQFMMKQALLYDAHVETNDVAQRCFRSAEAAAATDNGAASLRINCVDRCIMPKYWHTYVDQDEPRMYYCNAITRQGIWGRKAKKAYKGVNHHRKDDDDDVVNNITTTVHATPTRPPANLDTLALRMYSNRFEKDFTRSFLEWSFFKHHNALEQFWSMPIAGTHLDAT